MSIFSRLSDIVNSNLNAMLDKAEDPEKVIRLIVQEMEDTLVEVRSSAARTIADRKAHQRQLEQLEADRTAWRDKAELAVSRGRDDLAKGALAEKVRLGLEVENLQKHMAQIQLTLDKYGEDIAALQAKLDDAKARQKTLLMRRKTAVSQLRVRAQIDDGRIDKAMNRFEQFEKKLDDEEGQVEAWDLGRKQHLAAEIGALESDEVAERELAELKSRLGRGGPAEH